MASSIAVVTQRTGMALAMSSATHHFVEVRPLAGWEQRDWTEQVVVLDLGTAQSTQAAIETLAGAGVRAQVVVIAAAGGGWDALLRRHSDLAFVSLPVVRGSLLAAVDRALGDAGREPEHVPAENGDPQVSDRAGPTDDAAAENAVAADQPAPGSAPDVEPRPHRTHARPRGGRRDKPREPVVRRGPQPPTDPSVAAAAATAAAESPNPPTREMTPVDARADRAARVHRRQEVMGLVRSLQRDAGQLGRVRDVAGLVRDRCASAVPCDASAVLVPDDEVWRVAAGARLRPLEQRLEVRADHWLVSEVVTASHGLLIRDTDIVRARLSGSPLASWPHLLALPVTEARSLVMLAREGKGFSEDDLARAHAGLDDGGRLLRDALEVRDLARTLSDYVDRPD
jgi:hypothetical protein